MKKRKKSLNGFQMIIITLVLIFIYTVGQKGFKMYLVYKETARTKAQVEKLEEEKKSLEKEKDNLGDISYIEKIAREEHNMVRKGEIPIFIIEEKENGKNADEKKK